MLDGWVVFVYWLLIVLGSYCAHKAGHGSALLQFGGENGNIAESLARGEGFAGAMGLGSGPTAWMPPLLPWLYSLIFLIFGIRTDVAAAAAFGVKSLFMAVTLQQLLSLLRRTEWRAQRWVVYPLALAFLWLDQFRVLYELDDVWLQNLLIGLALSALYDLSRDCGTLTWRSTLCALLLPLSSPVSAVAFYVANLAIALRALRLKLSIRALVLCCLLSSCVTGSWMTRNRVALGEAYPIKSNIWYDFVEANLWAEEGILADSLFGLYHPHNPNVYHDQYMQLGESAFLDYYHQESARISNGSWLRRCLRRTVNAAIFLMPEMDCAPGVGLSVPDQWELAQACLIGYFQGEPIWLYCNGDEAETERALKKLTLSDPTGVAHSRATARFLYFSVYGSCDWWLWGVAHASLPSLSILVLVLSPSMRRDPLAMSTVCFYVTFEIPYILVSHYERYQVGLTTAQILLMTLAYCALVHRSQEPEASPSTDGRRAWGERGWRKERLWTALLFVYFTALATWWAYNLDPSSPIHQFVQSQGAALNPTHNPNISPGTAPVLANIYAAIIAVTGARTVAFFCVAGLLRSLAAGLSLYLLQGWCRRLGIGAMRAAPVLAGVFFYMDRTRALGELHDPWFLNLCGCITLEILIRLEENPQQRIPGPLLFGTVLLPLSSPTFFGILLVGLLWLCLSPLRRPTRPMLAVLLVACPTFLMWGIRTDQASHRSDSPLTREVAQAQVYEETGLFSDSYASFSRFAMDNRCHLRYIPWPEARFLGGTTRWQEGEPASIGGWSRQVASRFLSQIWRLEPDLDITEVCALPLNQLNALLRAGWVRYYAPSYVWLHVNCDPTAAEEAISALPVHDPKEIFVNREQTIRLSNWRERGWDALAWSYGFSLLPSLACLLCLSLCRGPESSRSRTRPPWHGSLVLCLMAHAVYLLFGLLTQHCANFQLSDAYWQFFLEVAALQAALGWLPRLYRRVQRLDWKWLDASVVLCYGAILMAAHWRWSGTEEWTNLRCFGYEYGSIAESLVRGEGFGGCMCQGSGPTAWMPPLLAWIYALIFSLFGLRTDAAVLAAWTLKSLGMVVTFFLLLRLLHRAGWGRHRWLLYILAFVYLYIDEEQIFRELHDDWLVTLVTSLALGALLEMHRNPGKFTWSLGISALILPLVSPVAAAVFYACALGIALRSLRLGRPVILALTLSLCVAGSWTVRNKIVLGEAFPIKSNAWFDFVEANLWDEEGVLTDSFCIIHHPWHANPCQAQYLSLGERAFINFYRQEATRVTTTQWLKRCWNRLLDAAWVLTPVHDLALAVGLPANTHKQLAEAGLICRVNGNPYCWTFCGRDTALFSSRLNAISLTEVERRQVLSSRRQAVAEYQERRYCLHGLLFGLAHTLLITLAIGVILRYPKTRRDPLATLTVSFYVLFQLPYILVQHNQRYLLCIVGLQLLLITLACATLQEEYEDKFTED